MNEPEATASCGGLFIPLTQGKFTVVSFEDAAVACRQKWSAAKWWSGWYAIGRPRGRKARPGNSIVLHRVLVGGQTPMVDHHNRDTLDNRRYNLRPCTGSQNQANAIKQTGRTSQFKGVSWAKKDLAWQVRITILQRPLWLGLFRDEETAALAYDAKARELFGRFARTNFPAVRGTT